MRVGIIAPVRFLRKYCTTSIQYCLPKLIVENKEYREFYLERQGKKNTIILDTKKVGWRREPESYKVIHKALSYIDPTYVILPSHMFDCGKTTDEVREFRKIFKDLPNLIGCPEGTNLYEVRACKNSIGGVASYAIPSHLYTIQGIKKCLSWGNPIIFIDNHLCLDELSKLEGILVTSFPLRLGLEGRLLSNYRPSPPSLTFYEEEDKYPMITKKNVEETLEFYEV